MFTSNPFAALNGSFSPTVMQVYLILMTLAVVAGTLFDVVHKGSATYFARRQAKSAAAALRQLSGGQRLALAIETVAEAAVSGEFCKWPRRISHMMMMYGFFAYILSTVVFVFGYPGATIVPGILPTLWTLGAFSILIGGLWFFFFLRVNVAFDGASPFSLGRADLFVGSLIASVASGLAWHAVQTASQNPTAVWILFGIYMFFTTLLFVGVPWSKFAHMFFKPTVAFQRRVEEADGSSDLPPPCTENYIVRS